MAESTTEKYDNLLPCSISPPALSVLLVLSLSSCLLFDPFLILTMLQGASRARSRNSNTWWSRTAGLTSAHQISSMLLFFVSPSLYLPLCISLSLPLPPSPITITNEVCRKMSLEALRFQESVNERLADQVKKMQALEREVKEGFANLAALIRASSAIPPSLPSPSGPPPTPAYASPPSPSLPDASPPQRSQSPPVSLQRRPSSPPPP